MRRLNDCFFIVKPIGWRGAPQPAVAGGKPERDLPRTHLLRQFAQDFCDRRMRLAFAELESRIKLAASRWHREYPALLFPSRACDAGVRRLMAGILAISLLVRQATSDRKRARSLALSVSMARRASPTGSSARYNSTSASMFFSVSSCRRMRAISGTRSTTRETVLPSGSSFGTTTTCASAPSDCDDVVVIGFRQRGSAKFCAGLSVAPVRPISFTGPRLLA